MHQAKKVFVKTYGCQMNVYDGTRIGESMTASGYVETGDVADADLIVLNTCHIREKAAEKVYSELGRIARIKSDRRSQGKDTVVTVAGCVAQAEGAEIARRASVVDVVVGPQSYHRLPDLIEKARAGETCVIDTEFPDEDKFSKLPPRATPVQAAAFLTVQEGCDKFCTFCVVPYTRGIEYSRTVDEIVREAETLIARGVREITLLGQNVNGYHGIGPGGREYSLARLIETLAQLKGLERLRYTTSHPRDMGEDLIAAHRDIDVLMPHLHLPFQAGSDRILAAMNRKYTAAEYLRLIEKIRAARPDIALSTDIIVGFPGETDEEFAATLDVVREVEFAQSYSFKYSARPGTPAATMAGQIAPEVADARLHRLQDLLQSQQRQFNDKCVGRTFQVLFEKTGRHAGQLIGRSPYLQAVHATLETSFLGHIVPVEISSAGANSLAGAVRPQALA